MTAFLAVTLGGCLWVLIDAGRAGHRRGIAAVRQVARYDFRLTPKQANDLYNDIYVLRREAGIVSANSRGSFAPTLMALYDGLAAAGVFGDAA